MNATKKKKLQQAGWSVGSASDFLELDSAEEAIVEMKLALGTRLRDVRREQRLTQQEVAERIGSSQSRVAKMETADKSVSMELLVKSLVSLGTTKAQIGSIIGRPANRKKTPIKRSRKKKQKEQQPA